MCDKAVNTDPSTKKFDPECSVTESFGLKATSSFLILLSHYDFESDCPVQILIN